MDRIAEQAISGLKQVNERRWLQIILIQYACIEAIDLSTLFIQADEVGKRLRDVNEQNLLQKLKKFEFPLILPNLDEFSCHVKIAQKNLIKSQDGRILKSLSKEPSPLHIDELGRLEDGRSTAIYALRHASELLRLEFLNSQSVNLEIPSLETLAAQGKIAWKLLRNANDLMILEQMNKHTEPLALPHIARFAARVRFVSKILHSAHGTRTLTKIYKAERNRRKIIKDCYFHAEWAGSDLHRWDKVFAEYGKYPKKLNILYGLIEEAHSKFALILSDTQNLIEIKKHCENDPFLQYEYGILKEKVDKYYKEQEIREEASGNIADEPEIQKNGPPAAYFRP